MSVSLVLNKLMFFHGIFCFGSFVCRLLGVFDSFPLNFYNTKFYGVGITHVW